MGHELEDIKSKSHRLPRNRCTAWPISTRSYTRWPTPESQVCCLPVTYSHPRKKDHSDNLTSPPPNLHFMCEILDYVLDTHHLMRFMVHPRQRGRH